MNDGKFSYETEEQQKKKVGINPKGCAFLAFFFIMVAAMIITSFMGNITACIICFGILCIVVGIMGFFSEKPSLSRAPVLLVSVAGALAIIIPLAKKYIDANVDMSELQFNPAPAIVIGIFMIIGLCFLLIPTINYVYKKTHYTPVMAVCKELDMHYSRSKNGGRTKVYAPTWEYYFEGEFITVKSNSYSNIDVPEVGAEYELYINPENPRKFYRPSIKLLIFFIIFGSAWTLFSVIAAIAS